MSAYLRLRDGIPEPWASEWGEDRYGLFIGFSVGGVTQRLRYIPPGEFLMGSPPSEVGRFDDEEQHLGKVAQGLWLADTPCTQALWQVVMGENPSQFQDPKRPTLPVEQVSWDDCQIFLQRLNHSVPGLVARLPNEAEWEYACRAGAPGATWLGELQGEEASPNVDTIAWYESNSQEHTHPVKSKAANPWGLYDMLGLVWEWCHDEFAQRSLGSQSVEATPSRVTRGGSWLSPVRNMRSAIRSGSPRSRRQHHVGFRIAVELEPA